MDHYMLVFPEAPSRDAIMQYFSQRCRRANFDVDESSAPKGLLILQPSIDDLKLEATRMKLEKRMKNSEGMRAFDVEDEDSFVDVNSPEFFLPFEKMHMIGAILNALKVDEEFLEVAGKHGWKGNRDSRLVPGGNLIISAKSLGYLETATPVHNQAALGKLWKESLWRVLPPVDRIRNYFGEEVGFYWAWMTFYTLFLIVPAFAGMALFLLNTIEGWTVDDSPYVPFFSVFMVIWATLFMKFWARQSMKWAHKWDTLDSKTKDTVRPDFSGKISISPITGEPELYYPRMYRLIKYVGSAIVTGSIICVAFVLMMMSLNLQGYVHEANSLFYFYELSQFSSPGAIFDPKSANFVVGLIPTVMHVAIIQGLNKLYTRVAERLTDWENHKTEQSHENSLILKRFVFEAFDSYIPLFYLAFYERDVMKVRRELVSLYTVDCLRRLATECLLPVGMQIAGGRDMRHEMKRLKSTEGENPRNFEAVVDSKKDPYEEFDDYLEMVISFGNITMFASAFPLASFVQLLYNLIEMKSDLLKLCYISQRPPVARERNIGSWGQVLSFQATLSLFTNVVLFAFSSEQMMQWFPSYFSLEDVDSDGDLDPVIASGKGRFVFIIILAVEHALGLFTHLLDVCIPNVPKSVRIALKKKEYEAEKVLSTIKRSAQKTEESTQE